jgi:hypothetical protein
MKRSCHLFALLTLLMGCVGPSDWRAYQRGRAKAERDTARGVLVHWSSGCCLPAAAASEYHYLLRECYGIEVRMHRCRDTRELACWRNGYNEISERIIADRWGTNVWAATWSEAERLYAQKNKP